MYCKLNKKENTLNLQIKSTNFLFTEDFNFII